MKKIVIVGAGTAGLAAAAMMKSYWKDKVDITLIYDKSRGNISVGESTTPIFRLLLGHLGVSTKELINDIGGKATIKLGIKFKNWIPNSEYFHGFAEIEKNIEFIIVGSKKKSPKNIYAFKIIRIRKHSKS